MKNFTQWTRVLVALLVVGFLLPSAVFAQVKWVENFDYPVGDLNGQGGWGRYGSNPNNPIQVIDEKLDYTGYPGGVGSKSVKLTGPSLSEDLLVRFDSPADGITSGNLYYAVLLRVEAAPATAGYSMTLLTRSKSNEVKPGTSPGEYGRLYFNKGADEQHFKLGVERGSAKPVYSQTEYEVGKTYLVVVKYAMEEVTDNEKVSLFVNPQSFTEEPAAADAEIATGAKRSRGFQGFELRQAGNSKGDAVTMLVGSLRISDTYAGLFSETSVKPEQKPSLSLPVSALDFGPVYQGIAVEHKLNLKATNLKGDVTLTVPEGELTVQPTTLPAAQLMNATGVEVTFTLSNPTSEIGKAEVVFASDGMENVTLPVTWNAQPVVEKKTLADFKGENAELNLTYRYMGKAVVTFVDRSQSNPKYYVQDETAGMVLQGETDLELKEGDAVTGLMGTITSAWGVTTFQPLVGMPIVPTETGVAVAPLEVTLAALKATPSDYLNRLVKVSNVSFQEVAEGATFTEGMTQPVIKDETGEGKVRIFKGTNLIGTFIPTEVVDLVGLSTSASAVLVAPRSAADVVLKVAPSLEITAEELKMEHGYVGKQTPLWTLHVKAVNLPGEVTIESTGKDRALFTPSVATLPAGNSELDLVITYAPTKIGKHSARIQFDCLALPTLSQAVVLQAYATDENNPPLMKVTPQQVPTFETKVDEAQEQTILVKTAFLPDYGKIELQTADAFRLSTTMLMKDNEAQVKVTFSPTKEGTYENALILSALGADTLVVPLTGKAAPSTAPEPEKEGDELPLDATNPLTILQENFDGVQKNQVLSLKGWKNLATTGKRAWWGMEFDDTDELPGEKAAKVTPFDSKVAVGEDEACEMMLVTPALDFVNAKSKIFTFRVRGDYLRDNQPESLELCYIDMADGQLFIQPINVPIPAQKDLSGEWNEFHVDLTNNQLADVFFMGFRFKGNRGRENSATYYIDDVSYGRTDLPVILSSTDVITMEALLSKDAVSKEITITTQNIDNPVKLSIGGPNRSKFDLTTKELPAEGGTFQVKFNSDQLGVHEAYVKLSSRGAADKYVVLSVNCVTQLTGIEGVHAETYAAVRVFDAAGRLLRTSQQATENQALAGLAPGTYVLQLTTDKGVVTKKVKR